MVRVRYWAAARTAAGRTVEEIEVDTVGALLAAISTSPQVARVVGASSLLVDGIAVPVTDADRPLRGDELVDVLPPFAGG